MTNPPDTDIQRLEYLPISLFTTVMGLCGLTLAWDRAQSVFDFDWNLHLPMLVLSTGVFFVLAFFYTLKFFRHREAVLAEWRNPIKLSFFPALSISLVLLSIAWADLLPLIAEGLWLAGATLHLIFTLSIVNAWLHHDHFEIAHINPAWFIPAVGNVLVPIGGTDFGHNEVSWLFFSVGMLFWLILMVLVFNRVIFHAALPDKMLPTLFILIAPPSVGFLAYLSLVGELDAFGRVLYFMGLFLTMLLVSQGKRFLRLPFFLTWWAYSFPVAAITLATLTMYDITRLPSFQWLSVILLGLLSFILAVLILKTSMAVLNKKICLPE